MADSDVWGISRSITFILVVALHLAAIALLVTGSRTFMGFRAASLPIELIFLPAVEAPKVRINSARPRRLSVDTAISLAPLDVTPDPASAAATPASNGGDGGRGPAVDWVAEAHRAIEAFEIRRDQQVSHSVLGSSPWDEWLPKRGHRAGDRFRTENGDWVVWINADCYQVASWHAGAPAPGMAQPQTICPGAHGAE